MIEIIKERKREEEMIREREYWRKGRELNLFPKVPMPKWLNAGDRSKE